jgi:molybdopterin converting factor subunit 1
VSNENRNETDQIVVRVLFFGAARDAAGQAEITLSLSHHTNVASAFDQVLDAFPDLRRFGRSLLFAVNEEYARPEREVRAGDELAVFPPVSGGAKGL